MRTPLLAQAAACANWRVVEDRARSIGAAKTVAMLASASPIAHHAFALPLGRARCAPATGP